MRLSTELLAVSLGWVVGVYAYEAFYGPADPPTVVVTLAMYIVMAFALRVDQLQEKE